MLYKVILKNYKSHLKNYIAFFACSVCTVAMLFAFWGIQDTFGENLHGGNVVCFLGDTGYFRRKSGNE